MTQNHGGEAGLGPENCGNVSERASGLGYRRQQRHPSVPPWRSNWLVPAGGSRLSRTEAPLLQTVEQINAEHGADAAIGILVDVTRPCEVERAAETVALHFGPIDLLVNNAGT